MDSSPFDMTARAIASARIVLGLLVEAIADTMNGVPFLEGYAIQVPLSRGYSLRISFLTEGELPLVDLYRDGHLTTRPEWGYDDSGSHPIGDGVSLISSNTIARLILEIYRVDDLIVLSN